MERTMDEIIKEMMNLDDKTEKLVRLIIYPSGEYYLVVSDEYKDPEGEVVEEGFIVNEVEDE